MFKKRQLLFAFVKHAIKAIIAIILCVIAITIISNRITKISTSLQEKKIMALILEKRSITATTLRDHFNTIGDNDKKIRDAFLSTDNVLEFVNAIETAATQHSMQQTIKFGTPGEAILETEDLTILPISFSITANGTITTVTQYLKQVEMLPYFAEITSLTLATASPQGWTDASSITIQGILYVKKTQ